MTPLYSKYAESIESLGDGFSSALDSWDASVLAETLIQIADKVVVLSAREPVAAQPATRFCEHCGQPLPVSAPALTMTPGSMPQLAPNARTKKAFVPKSRTPRRPES